MGSNLKPIDLGKAGKVVSLTPGWFHTCALLDTGKVKCWGLGGDQLGLEHYKSIGVLPGQMGDNLPFVQISGTKQALRVFGKGGHSCATLSDKSVKCWGQNYSGILGYEDVKNRGAAVGDMGEGLPNVNVAGDVEINYVRAGGIITCALVSNNAVKCWGDNSHGALGLGDMRNRGTASGEMGDNLPYVDLGRLAKVREIYTSGWHSCALIENSNGKLDTIKCWGLNGGGQLGTGDSIYHGTVPGTMGDKLPEVNL